MTHNSSDLAESVINHQLCRLIIEEF